MKRNTNFPVVFTTEDDAIKAIYTDNIYQTIFVFPRKDRWNDFKYKSYGKFMLRLTDELVVSELMYVAVLVEDDMRQNDYLQDQKKELVKRQTLNFHDELLAVPAIDVIVDSYVGIGNLYPYPIKLSSFFTLLEDMGAYRRLVNRAGSSRARKILNSLNDLVEIKSQTQQKLLFKQAISSEIFKLSFMRNSEAFFAYHNAQDILKGLKFEYFDYISKELRLTFKLDGFSNTHDINFSFNTNTIIPGRINILIGENGLGKSQALNHFVRSALRQREYITNLVALDSQNERPMISRLLAIVTPGESNDTYPSDTIRNPKLYYKKLNLNRNTKSKNKETVCSNLIRLIRNTDLIGEKTRYDIFINALQEFFSLDDVVIPLKKEAYYANEFGEYITLNDVASYRGEESRLSLWSQIDELKELRIQYKDTGQQHLMSSGQISFFKFALLACLHIENGSFVLLDEPETHLHPSFISSFIALLDNILEGTGSYGIIATHSPYFVREVAREQVHVFKKTNDGAIHISHPKLKTFGANIGDISYFVFDEEITNRLSQKILDKANRESLSFEDIVSLSNSELPAEMLQEIKRKLS